MEAHPPPAICVSVWLPRSEKEEEKHDGVVGDNQCGNSTAALAITVEALQKAIDDHEAKSASGKPTVRVENAQHKPYHHPTDGRWSRTFRVHYLDCRNNKAKARARHKVLKEVTIPLHFPTVAIRENQSG
jgi:hypothetical protein